MLPMFAKTNASQDTLAAAAVPLEGRDDCDFLVGR
jgi:hypothetical protein